MHFTQGKFVELCKQAIDSLPEEFRQRMENIAVRVEPLPDKQTCREMELESPYDLLGFHKGVALTDYPIEDTFILPNEIVIYQLSIEDACDSQDEAIEQIRDTVLHEIGHFFGLDEDDLDDLGYS